MVQDLHHHLTSLVPVALFLVALPAAAEEHVRADRSPLTFRDAGLYTSPFREDADTAVDGMTNMLAAGRAVRPETPWTFYIIQHDIYESPPSDAMVSQLREMAKNGKKVILRAQVRLKQKTPEIDKMEQFLVTLFERVDPDLLYAITLDEENIYWDGWGDALTRLYYRAKARWPDLPVYQWWTPMEAPDVRATGGWVALPSDGWVLDLYGEPRKKFEQKLVKFLETGKPAVHIAWASPTWLRWSGADTVEGFRRILNDQIDVCRAYNVPVAYFCNWDEKAWGWHSKDPVMGSFYRELEALVMNFRHVPDESIGYRTLNEKLFDWAHSSDAPVGVSYQLDEEQRKQATIECDLAPVPVEPGTHPVATAAVRPRLAVTCLLDDSARRLDGGLRVRGVKDQQFRVPIVFRIEPGSPVVLQAITAGVSATRDLGGGAILSWSVDGTSWQEPVSADPAKAGQALTVNLPGGEFTTDPVWVRVELISNSGLPTSTCSSLDGLRVIAALDDGIAGHR